MAGKELSPLEAAQVIGRSLHHVYELLRTGKIKGELKYGRWFVTEKALDDWKQRSRASHG